MNNMLFFFFTFNGRNPLLNRTKLLDKILVGHKLQSPNSISLASTLVLLWQAKKQPAVSWTCPKGL